MLLAWRLWGLRSCFFGGASQDPGSKSCGLHARKE